LEENEGEEYPIFKPAVSSGFQIAAHNFLKFLPQGAPGGLFPDGIP